MARSSLLINESPLQLLPSLAVAIGVDEAIVLQQIHYWINNPKTSGRMVDGEKWIHNTYEQWQEDNFPFWSIAKIRRIFKSLEDQGVIVSEQFDAHRRDMTKFYRIEMSQLCKLEASVLSSSMCSKSTHVKIESETTTETTRENKEEDKTNKITFAELSGFYCDNVELLTKWSSDYLFELFEEFGGHWVIEASKDAITLNRKNLKYIHAILNGWKRDGFRVDTRKGKQLKKNYDTQPKANRPSPEEW